MLKIDPNNTIHLTRGDSAYFNITITDINKEPYIVKDSDVLTFTVKKSTHDRRAILTKVAVDSVIKIEPSDTDALAYATYYYDVQLKTVDGDVFTVIPPAKFIICGEVTW